MPRAVAYHVLQWLAVSGHLSIADMDHTVQAHAPIVTLHSPECRSNLKFGPIMENTSNMPPGDEPQSGPLLSLSVPSLSSESSTLFPYFIS